MRTASPDPGAPRRFRIAGLPLALTLPPGPIARALDAAWAPFAAAPDDAGPWVEVSVETTAETLPPAPAVLEMPTVEVLADGRLRLRGQALEAEISSERDRVHVRGAAERFPVEAAIKVLLADRLLACGGLLVHGVGLERGGRAALFTGPSGAGKSTLGALCTQGGAALSLLADELVAIWPEPGPEPHLTPRWRAEGTPWNIGSPRRAVLTRVGLLAFAQAARLEDEGRAEVLRVLLLNAVMPDSTPAGRARLFHAGSALLNAVPAARLRFARAPDVVDVLAGALGDAAR